MSARIALHNPSQVALLHREKELILRCVRVQHDAANRERIDTILRAPLDWNAAIEFAIHHRIAPFVYEKLTEAGACIPPAQQTVLREIAIRAARSSLVLLQELIRLQELFAAESLVLIPSKGPVLAWLAFQDFTRREFTDLDFILPQKNIPQATALLRRVGYREKFDLREAHGEKDGFVPGQYLFVREKQALQVELHTERTQRYFPVELDFDEMRQRLIAVEIAGRPIQIFSLEETLVMLCVHGAKHFWERLSWILDIAALLSAQPIDWDRALQAAQAMQSTRLLLLGLVLAHDMLAAPLPEFIVEKARRDTEVLWLAKIVHRQYEGDAHGIGAHLMSRTAFRLRSPDGLLKGIRHLARLSTVPTESDRRMVRLPEALTPLYIFLRPLRLLRDSGIAARRRP
jgi:hypothetical protein